LVAVLAAALVLGTVGVVNAAAPVKTTFSWAEVLYDGTIQGSSGGISISHPGTGAYLVNFGKDVTRCAITVTSGIANEQGAPVLGVNAEVAAVFPAPNPLTPAVVQVREDIGQTATDYSFSVVAFCP
jgi:hypothetical protein